MESELEKYCKFATDEIERKCAVATEEIERKCEKLTKECNELKEYKDSVERESRKEEQCNLFSQFTDLTGIDEFETLKSNCEDMSIAEIEEKCFAIRGKHMLFSKVCKRSGVQLPVHGVITNDADPYGGVVSKYIRKK